MLRYIYILLSIILFLGCSKIQEPNVVKEGNINLSTWNFDNQGVVELRGDWFFHEKELISENWSEENPQQMISVPGTWDNRNDSSYASFQVNVKLPVKHQDLALKVSTQGTAYKLFFNKQLVAEVGRVGKTEQNSAAYYYPAIYPINVSADTLKITFEVSNYQYRKGGLWDKIIIGDAKQLQKLRDKFLFFDFFLIGALLLIMLYHIGLFFLRRNDKSTLYFSALCFLAIIRIVSTGEILISQVFTHYNWELLVKLELVSFFMLPAFGSLFIYSFYREEFSRVVLKLIIVVASSFSLGVIATSAVIYTHFVVAYEAITLIILLYLFFVLILAFMHRRDNSKLFLIAYGVIVLCAVNDILNSQNIISTAYLIPFGIFVNFFAQSIALSRRFSNAFNEIEVLSNVLLQFNQTLEQKVSERTDELNKQKEELQLKNTVITASISYAQKIQSAILPPQSEINEMIPENFVLFLPKDIVSGDFYWIKQINQYIFFAAADCMGHGVPAGFLSMLGYAFLNEIVTENIRISAKTFKANEILNLLRRKMKETLRQNDVKQSQKGGMDIALCIIDVNTLKLQYAGANSPMYVIKKEFNRADNFAFEKGTTDRSIENLIELPPDKMPIGVYHNEKETFTNNEIQLEEGDCLYVFSDGYSDQFGGDKGRKFYSRRLKELLVEHSTKNMGEQYKVIEKSFYDWKGTNDQIDDVLMIGIRVSFKGQFVPKLHNWKTKSILVAEDDEFSFIILKEYLKETNVKINRAINGQEAINRIDENLEVDIILMELVMPIVDGIEATMQIKQKKPNLPIIVLTSQQSFEEKSKSFEAGCDDYILKPVNRKELFATIDKYFSF